MGKRRDKPLGNCPNCRGQGWVEGEYWYIRTYTNPEANFKTRLVKHKCRQCAGTGNLDAAQQHT